MVTMVPVRGGRAAPLVKAAISVNPAIGASAPIWVVVAIGGMAAACTPATTVPLGVRSCLLHCLLSRYLPRQLELISVIIGRNRVVGATGT
jgi:hypothetical protein